MKHLGSPLLLLALALTACPPPPDGSSDFSPQIGKWKMVAENINFPVSGDGKITTITIGRREFTENFANRGDIEVLFDHDDETISIEMRHYLYGTEADAFGGEDGSEGLFDRLALWAYKTTSNPKKPSEMKAADNCLEGGWKDDCKVYVYYDGKTQPARLGADLRVHLPKGYRGKLNVETEDNADEEQSFPKRGNVTVDGLCSGGELKFEAGRGKIKMCRELTPAPLCSAADITACEEYPDGSGSEAWSKDCPCGGGDLFGQLRIEAPQPWAANITVDIPPQVWLNATLQNTSTDKPHDCIPEIANCTGDNCVLEADDMYAPHAEFNYPSPSAAQGAGFNLTVISGGCTKIPYIDTADQWEGPDSEPPEELRGLLKVCTDCL